ncbi:MAG: ECF transporter S component [Candidatus Wallacebacter cryptica]
MFKINAQTRLVLGALLLAIGLVLPTVFHSFGIAGQVFLPMHIPVLLAGFILGWKYGAAIGFLVPLLTAGVITPGMPPLFPVGLGMAFELAAYGLLTGLLAQRLNMFAALVIAMVGGRLVMGIANAVLFGMAEWAYSFQTFIAGAFVTALPGIIVQLILVPAILAALKRARVFRRF